jgi:hypothetical protein
MEVQVVFRWLPVLIQCWSPSITSVEVCVCARVPRDSKAIDVEETVADCNLLFGGYVVRVIGNEFGQEVGVDLFGERVFLEKVNGCGG